jgi:hypothetical protein
VAGAAVEGEPRRRLSAARLVAPVLWRRVVLTSTALQPDTLATREVRALVERLVRLHGPDAQP